MLSTVPSSAIVTLSLRRASFPIFDLKNVVTLKSGSEVTQGLENGTIRQIVYDSY